MKNYLEDKDKQIAKLKEEIKSLKSEMREQKEIFKFKMIGLMIETRQGPSEIIAVLHERFDRKTVEDILLSVKCRMS